MRHNNFTKNLLIYAGYYEIILFATYMGPHTIIASASSEGSGESVYVHM